MIYQTRRSFLATAAAAVAAAAHPAVAAPRVFAALDKVRFRGWAVIELDRVSDNGHTPVMMSAQAQQVSAEVEKMSL
jgi:hypothetical protein